jgi:hypothetical protein
VFESYRKGVSIDNFLVMKFTARMLYLYSYRVCGVVNLMARYFKLKLFSYEIRSVRGGRHLSWRCVNVPIEYRVQRMALQGARMR